MSTAEVAALGAVAGFTIFLGLPMGRVEMQSVRTKTLLNGISAGILTFLLIDILANAGEVLDGSLTTAQVGGSWARFAGLTLCYGIGLGVGLMSLLYVGKAIRRRRASIGPGAMAYAETAVGRRDEALHLAMTIAAGIGLHNFSEGLAIGQAAHADEISSEYVFVAFLTLAAGAILYVIGELFSVGRKLSWEITLWGVLIGFLLGLGTELVIVAGGA